MKGDLWAARGLVAKRLILQPEGAVRLGNPPARHSGGVGGAILPIVTSQPRRMLVSVIPYIIMGNPIRHRLQRPGNEYSHDSQYQRKSWEYSLPGRIERSLGSVIKTLNGTWFV